jgi:hypothetical protein
MDGRPHLRILVMVTCVPHSVFEWPPPSSHSYPYRAQLEAFPIFQSPTLSSRAPSDYSLMGVHEVRLSGDSLLL